MKKISNRQNSILKICILFCLALLLGLPVADAQKKKSRRTIKNYPPEINGAEEMVYKTVGDVKLNLYVFTPEGHTSKDRSPAIVFFFGGGWRGGSPSQFIKQCEYLASRGMVAITADYRVLSRQGARAIQCVADAKSAIRFVRKNADKLGVDPDRIVASGGSAGGHIAACTGVVSGMEEPGEETTVSSVPNAMVLFNPALAIAPIDGKITYNKKQESMKERVGGDPESISPYHHVKKGQPPTIIFFGTDDNLLKGAKYFEKASKAAGNRCELLTWEGEKHGFFNYGRNNNKAFTETLIATDKFLESLGYLEGEPTIQSDE